MDVWLTVCSGLIGVVASVAGVFAATSCAVSGVRNKDDYLGRGVAGCAAGLAFGLKCESLLNFVIPT